MHNHTFTIAIIRCDVEMPNHIENLLYNLHPYFLLSPLPYDHVSSLLALLQEKLGFLVGPQSSLLFLVMKLLSDFRAVGLCDSLQDIEQVSAYDTQSCTALYLIRVRVEHLEDLT